ncbi:MAG: polysaccharide pyruvyl transferase family protein [Bacillota bacterium]
MKIAHIHVWDKTNKGDLGIVLAVQEILLSRFPGVIIEDFPIEVLKEYDKGEAERLNSADLIIMGGGGLFYRYFLPFSSQMIAALHKPFVIFGVGYIREVGAPALTRTERDSIIALAERADLLGVRENYTKRFLVKYGLPSEKVKVIGDPALLLSESEGAALSAGVKIGFNLNYSGWLGFGSWRDDILDAYRETAQYFQQKYGANIYYLKHHPGEDKIYPELGINNLTVIDEEPHKQKGQYGKLDLVIGMMLHSCVMAAGALTPEINVAYDLRNRNFARFLGIPEAIVELPQLRGGVLLKRAKHFYSHQEEYRRKLEVFKRQVTRRTSGFLDEIQEICKEKI